MAMILFGLACMAVYAINSYAAANARPRYIDAQGCAVMLTMAYGLSNGITFVYGLPDAILAYPLIDLVLTWMVMRAWFRERRMWKLGLAGLLVVQLTAHAAFILAWQNGNASAVGLWYYASLINGTFALQLLTVGSSGVSYVLGRLVAAVSDRGGLLPVSHGR